LGKKTVEWGLTTFKNWNVKGAILVARCCPAACWALLRAMGCDRMRASRDLNGRVTTMTDFATRRMTMVDTQVRPSDVTKFPIIDAMLTVPREEFVPADRREAAYVGEHLDLGAGRVVLDPRSFAKLLDAVDVQPDELVLDVGAAYGYSTAVLARMAEAVVALEEDLLMAAEAENALSRVGADNSVVVTGALTAGSAKHAPFDVIVVQGAVEHLPEALIAQLKDGGRIGCLFAEGANGVVRVGYKMDGAVSWRFAFNASAPVLPGFERHRAFTL